MRDEDGRKTIIVWSRTRPSRVGDSEERGKEEGVVLECVTHVTKTRMEVRNPADSSKAFVFNFDRVIGE